MIYFAKINLPPMKVRGIYTGAKEWELFFIKIGKSVNPAQRIKQLAWEYTHRVTLLATMPGDLQEEQEMHARFTSLRVSHKGTLEWFYPGTDLMDFVKNLQNNSESVLTLPRQCRIV